MSVAPIVPADDAGIARAVHLLRTGELVVLPTDTVYGLAAALDRPEALRRIFIAKSRSEIKNLPILLSGRELLARVAANLDPDLARLADRFWPGPLTIAVAAKPGLPVEVLAPDGTVGVRVPADPIARRIIGDAGGALAVTSANAAGAPPATTAAVAAHQLGEVVALIVDGGPSAAAVASTVIRLEAGEPRILRHGAITPAELLAAWREICHGRG